MILDSPPVLPVADSVALARVVDGVLVVAQANRVSTRDVAESLARLERVGAPIIGIVLNRARGAAARAGYGYGYGYGYRAPEERRDVSRSARRRRRQAKASPGRSTPHRRHRPAPRQRARSVDPVRARARDSATVGRRAGRDGGRRGCVDPRHRRRWSATGRAERHRLLAAADGHVDDLDDLARA